MMVYLSTLKGAKHRKNNFIQGKMSQKVQILEDKTLCFTLIKNLFDIQRFKLSR